MNPIFLPSPPPRPTNNQEYSTTMLAATLILTSCSLLHGVNAWGVLGHATVGFIAQNYVTDSTKSWSVDTSHLMIGKTSVLTVSKKKKKKKKGKYSAPFHFIDAEDSPPSSCNVNYSRDCGNNGCSISAIANYTQRVTDGRLSSDNRNEALKFIVHFLGDITQPLHDEAYKLGANEVKVTFDGYQDNLHADWDTYIPEKIINGSSSLEDAKSWANHLIAEVDSGAYKSQAPDWIKGDSIDDIQGSAVRWASDANSFVCSMVMPDGEAALEKGDLYPDYFNSVAPTVELQIVKGGYRLANWLNMIVAGGNNSSTTSLVSRLADLSGRDLLPEPKPLSRAKLARLESGYNCNHSH